MADQVSGRLPGRGEKGWAHQKKVAVSVFRCAETVVPHRLELLPELRGDSTLFHRGSILRLHSSSSPGLEPVWSSDFDSLRVIASGMDLMPLEANAMFDRVLVISPALESVKMRAQGCPLHHIAASALGFFSIHPPSFIYMTSFAPRHLISLPR